MRAAVAPDRELRGHVHPRQQVVDEPDDVLARPTRR